MPEACKVRVINTGAATNTIYSADDSLPTDRTIEMAGNSISFENAAVNQWLLEPDFFGAGIPKLTFPGVVDPLGVTFERHDGSHILPTATQESLYVSDGGDGETAGNLIYKNNAGLLIDISGGVGGGGANFSNTDLTATGQRTHTFGGNNLTINWANAGRNSTLDLDEENMQYVAGNGSNGVLFQLFNTTELVNMEVLIGVTGFVGHTATLTTANIHFDNGTVENRMDVDVGGIDFIINAAADMSVNGAAGNSGQVLTSQGVGNPPIWTTPTGSGDNFANANLTADANRTHDFSQYNLSLDWNDGGGNVGNFDITPASVSITGTDGADTFSFTMTHGPSQVILQQSEAGETSGFKTTPTVSELFYNQGANISRVVTQVSGIDLIIDETSDLSINSSPGTTGQLLASQGNNLPPIWLTPTFLALSDTPGAFGGAGFVVAINGTNTALEFIDPTTLDTNTNYANNDLIADDHRVHDWSIYQRVENYDNGLDVSHLFIGAGSARWRGTRAGLGISEVQMNVVQGASLTWEPEGNTENLVRVGQVGVELEFSDDGNSELQIDGDPGAAGEAILSQGPNLPPVWGSSPNYISQDLSASANRLHDWGAFSLTENYIDGADSASMIQDHNSLDFSVTDSTAISQMILDAAFWESRWNDGTDEAKIEIKQGLVATAPQLHFLTNAIDGGTALTGQALVLQDQVTGEVEFTTLPEQLNEVAANSFSETVSWDGLTDLEFTVWSGVYTNNHPTLEVHLQVIVEPGELICDDASVNFTVGSLVRARPRVQTNTTATPPVTPDYLNYVEMLKRESDINNEPVNGKFANYVEDFIVLPGNSVSVAVGLQCLSSEGAAWGGNVPMSWTDSRISFFAASSDL